MKLSSAAVAASVLATSTAALSSSHPSSFVQELRVVKGGEMKVEKEKFSPRFDGLKFIKTLVMAHR
ncbi:hypothetical protein HanRHA438_Chr11g0514641 [Helianthus annuus]|uniref:Uncharacterized protein n=1 Tax=Helianthus annuus TaxID=4232 RepID=A0A9K3N0W3_HELAN|nr:hypothetical protein HanXRQr2_Chr11g0502061 [Helianthus annuus]KAJ0502369.1 hypothetical protein HanHA300_Chr11g0412131 [Helianthus annuus]KAJ0510405.1 hypothetical protein HanIR_Chr11g0540461 [Helianthus annuus]KAJ0518290.1 hypothetical protein HanHA89_Chr11g0435791 [Helianthus annuus]KAJ0686324.1 hypothetical protein HanLR1_Chr11g0413471 [Helianthus annuus]